MILLQLFYEFFKAGLFAVGGGLATLPFLYDIAEKTNWFTTDMLMNMIAISESTPGPIGINMATYVGFTTAGILGSITATTALVFPSVVIIIFVYKILEKFKEDKGVQSAFYGLRPAVTAMIAAAGFQVVKLSFLQIPQSGFAWDQVFSIIEWRAVILFAVLFFLIKKYKKHPLVYIAASAAAGILLHFGG